MVVQNDIQNLTEYFSRPVAITSFDITTGPPGNQFTRNFLPQDILSVFPNYLNRLSGVYGIRFSTVFTLQIACTPFHQGVLAMGFQYGDIDITSTYARYNNYFAITNLPHVRLDLSTDTMVQLKVPFLYTFEYHNLGAIGDDPPFGSLGVSNIATIPSVVGLAAPRAQVFVHLEDIEFFGASPLTSSLVALQAGRKLSPITEEFDDESRPLSSTAMALSKVTKYVSKYVPMLSSVGGPTSWALEKLAGGIRYFGFSKPTIIDPPARMQINDTVAEFNVDVPSNTFVVGPISKNTMRVSPFFAGADVDEMALPFVTSQYSQICNFDIKTTDPAGQLQYICPISPAALWFRKPPAVPFCNIFPRSVAPASTSAFFPSHLFYFGQMFKFWRGTLKYRFTFSKSKMHGGRIMVTYTPSDGYANEDGRIGVLGSVLVANYGSFGPNPNGYSAIFNLRDGNVFEFEVPYISPVPYTNFLSHTGALAMHIVDPLQAPSVVSSTINVIVEVSGGSDFEFSDPKTAFYPPHIGGTVTTQAGRLLSEVPESINELTVGEAMGSLKQLITIPHISPLGLTTGNRFSFYVPPWFYQPRYSVLVPAPTATIPGSFSFGGMIASCYAFVKGGTDVHLYSNQVGNTGGFWAAIRQNSLMALTQPTGQTPFQAPFSNNATLFSSRGNLHARLPAYQHILRYFSSVFNSVVSTGNSWNINGIKVPNANVINSQPHTVYRLTVASNVDTTAFFSSAAADDAACGHYFGPPPLLLLSTNTPSTQYDFDSNYALY